MKVRALAGVDAFASACSRKAVIQPRHLLSAGVWDWTVGGCVGCAGTGAGAPRRGETKPARSIFLLRIATLACRQS